MGRKRRLDSSIEKGEIMKPAPSQKLREVLGDLRSRFDIILAKINKAEAEGRIPKEKAEELRKLLK
jgi:hypothetical protein